MDKEAARAATWTLRPTDAEETARRARPKKEARPRAA